MKLQKKIWHVGWIIKKFFYKLIYGNKIDIPQSVTFRSGFKVLLEENANIVIGERVFFNNGCSMTAMNRITIGKNSIFGENVKIYDHNHVFKKIPMAIAEQGFKIGTVSIGDNCWIGSNVILLKGANIGNNCVVAAGSIVDYDVPDNCILKRNGKIEKIVVDD